MAQTVIWNNVWLRIPVLLLLVVAALNAHAAQSNPAHTPHLLLTAQLLRRLQRDRDRQTPRWVNFDNRVESTPDSSERGFELALYYAVTNDQTRGREAVDWALLHPCSARQVALILDWCWNLFSEDERRKLTGETCAASSSNPAQAARDAYFWAISRGSDANTEQWSSVLSWLEAGNLDGQTLYAACEYIMAVRANEHEDLRQQARAFFSVLPAEFLLRLSADEIAHPGWMTHLAAFALVAVDPNLEGSQYLQSWAMEDSQTLLAGPGVAYEFLWANPYLPGLGYQNLETWVYDPNGRLFARTSWDADACRIALSAGAAHAENCRSGWDQTPQKFGHLALIPVTAACAEVTQRAQNETVILWRLNPQEALSYRENNKNESIHADLAGILRLNRDIQGKICRSR